MDNNDKKTQFAEDVRSGHNRKRSARPLKKLPLPRLKFKKAWIAPIVICIIVGILGYMLGGASKNFKELLGDIKYGENLEREVKREESQPVQETKAKEERQRVQKHAIQELERIKIVEKEVIIPVIKTVEKVITIPVIKPVRREVPVERRLPPKVPVLKEPREIVHESKSSGCFPSQNCQWLRAYPFKIRGSNYIDIPAIAVRVRYTRDGWSYRHFECDDCNYRYKKGTHLRVYQIGRNQYHIPVFKIKKIAMGSRGWKSVRGIRGVGSY